MPKLREGSYFPDWLLQPRRRAEQAFVSVIADAYLAGVSTRRVEKLVQQLGVERMSQEPGLEAREEPRPDRRGLPHPAARRRARTPTSPWTRWWSSAARAAAPSTSASSTPSASTRTASASRSASTSSPPRTAPPGSRTSVAWSLAASPASSWSARTPTPASSTRSPRR